MRVPASVLFRQRPSNKIDPVNCRVWASSPQLRALFDPLSSPDTRVIFSSRDCGHDDPHADPEEPQDVPHFPTSALWVIGLLVGLDLIFNGWTWIMLSLAIRNIPEEEADAEAAPSSGPYV